MSGVLLISLFLISVASSIPKIEGVWELDPKTLEEALNLQPDLLVEFYAPWCEHCQRYAAEYSKLAQKLDSLSPPINIGRIDASKYDEIASTYKISGFPTLKFFTKGKVLDYTESKASEDLFEYILRRSRSNVKYFTSQAQLKELKSMNTVNVVLFSTNQTDPLQLLEDISKEFPKIGFFFTDQLEIADEFGVSQPKIVIFKDFDETRADFSGDFNENSLKKFIKLHRKPLVMEFTMQAVELLFKEGTPGVFLLTQNYEKYQSMYSKLAEKYKNDLIFIQDDLSTAFEGKLAMYFGLDAKEQPLVMLIDPPNENKKYRMAETISLASLDSFLKSWKDGTLTPAPKSQPVPLQPEENGVTVVVRSTFKKIVLDDTKDVLIEFYAPWCGHCSSFKPEYEKLAETFKDHPTVVIAKIDGTENDIDGLEIQGFPTFILYPCDIKQGVAFTDERSVANLTSFIKTYSRYYTDLGRAHI